MKKVIYILGLLLFSAKGFSFDEKDKNDLQIKRVSTVSIFKMVDNLHMHPNPEAYYMLEGDPIEYLFGMIHRNLNELYKKCGRYPLESEMPEALLKGEIKKLNCKIDAGLPDWKNHGTIRYRSFEEFRLAQISFQEKRFKYFSNHEKFIMTYKAPKNFIERGKKISELFQYKAYENGYFVASKGVTYGGNITNLNEIIDYCSFSTNMSEDGWRKAFCHIGKRQIIQYKE